MMQSPQEGGPERRARLIPIVVACDRSTVLCRGLSRPSRRLTRCAFLDLHAPHEVGNDESAFVSFDITHKIMAQTGIDEAMIERLVRGFYAKVQSDPVLGPIFAAQVGDWNAHITKLCSFW